jgi:hypothetical protein
MDRNKTDDGGVKLEDGWIAEREREERRLLQQREGKQSKEG